MEKFGTCDLCGGRRALRHTMICAPCHYRAINAPEALAVTGIIAAIYAWREAMLSRTWCATCREWRWLVSGARCACGDQRP
jgi:hypothetical protein